jgi:hypothetical protein
LGFVFWGGVDEAPVGGYEVGVGGGGWVGEAR